MKRNFIIYHFLVKSHKRIDLLIIASMYIYQTKKKKHSNSNENMKQFGNPLPFLKEPPAFN